MLDYDVDSIYTYHRPKPVDVEKYPAIRAAAKKFAVLVLGTCPEGRERAAALERIEEAVMWANTGIARAKEE